MNSEPAFRDYVSLDGQRVGRKTLYNHELPPSRSTSTSAEVDFSKTDFLPDLKAYLLEHGRPPPPFADTNDPLPVGSSAPLTSFACLRLNSEDLGILDWSTPGNRQWCKLRVSENEAGSYIPNATGRAKTSKYTMISLCPAPSTINTTVSADCEGVCLYQSKFGWVLWEGKMVWGLRVEPTQLQDKALSEVSTKLGNRLTVLKSPIYQLERELVLSDSQWCAGQGLQAYMLGDIKPVILPPGMARRTGGPVVGLTAQGDTQLDMMLLGHEGGPSLSPDLRWGSKGSTEWGGELKMSTAVNINRDAVGASPELLVGPQPSWAPPISSVAISCTPPDLSECLESTRYYA